MHKVFVYGTLKEGFPNFKTNNGVRFRSEFITKDSFPLYLLGDRFVPCLVLNEGSGHPIKGQVFSVSDETLHQMDVLERLNEKGGYHRVSIKVLCLESNEEHGVFVYGKPCEVIIDTDLKEELYGEYLPEHAANYCSRHV